MLLNQTNLMGKTCLRIAIPYLGLYTRDQIELFAGCHHHLYFHKIIDKSLKRDSLVSLQLISDPHLIDLLE